MPPFIEAKTVSTGSPRPEPNPIEVWEGEGGSVGRRGIRAASVNAVKNPGIRNVAQVIR